MGEIAEALKRANEELVQTTDPAPSDGGEITAALRRAEAEGQEHQSQPPAPPIPPKRQSARPPAPESTSAPAPSPEPQSSLGATTRYGQDQLDLHRHLALRIRGELERSNRKTLAVLSALRGEGKTTVAINLAMALASITPGRNVALVDLDLRNPSVARRMDIPVLTGIEEVIQGTQTLERVCLSLDDPELDLYPALTPHRAAHELLVGAGFDDMIRRLEQRYSTIIIDTPPTLLVPDSNLILRNGAACVAVANVGITRVRRFREMLQHLPAQQMLGKILNRTEAPKHQQGYYYYYGPEDEHKD